MYSETELLIAMQEFVQEGWDEPDTIALGNFLQSSAGRRMLGSFVLDRYNLLQSASFANAVTEAGQQEQQRSLVEARGISVALSKLLGLCLVNSDESED